ncbi:MAG: glycosyltransferase family 1 protein, partial [Actinomycetota bacterium]|nr:glycosyltransferase family 1 protein [Actinomycetota bacterium]
EGHTGFHVASGSVDDLTRRLRELSEAPELRARLGAAARARAITEFDASINADRLIRVAIAGAQADR